MKIGIDGRLWNETGVGRYIRNLVWELQKLDTKNDYVLFVKNGIRNQELGITAKNWKIVATDIHWHSLTEQIKFPQLLDKEHLDLMHFPYFSHPIFYRNPFVVTIHDLIINHFSTGKASTLPYSLYRLKRIGYDVVVNHAVKNSQKILVPLNAVKDDLIKTLGVSEKKIAVTYEGVEEKTKVKNQSFDYKKYFLYVGNAYPHKNLDRLIDAFVEFKKDEKDVQLILVGKDDYFYKRLRERIEKEQVEGILFRHNIGDAELFYLYSHAIVLISPSLMEGFGLTPLEAMSSSCPVLLSDIPSFREVCGDSAFYFDQTSSASLKEKMNLLYNLDHKTREKHITKGLARVKDFSWQKMAKETLAVYESCISLR